MKRNKSVIEFGDFQTPLDLAIEVVHKVLELSPDFTTIIEPSCGKGNFLKALTQVKCRAREIIGWEINPDYIDYIRDRYFDRDFSANINIKEQNFFDINWNEIQKKSETPILFIGNPPWVTNSTLGQLQGKNIPKKSNFNNYIGLEAITGKSNFDISESMLIRISEYISGNNSAMAFLIKTSVARKIYSYIHDSKLSITDIFIYEIDAKKYFNVNVSACLFYTRGTSEFKEEIVCYIYKSLYDTAPYKLVGIVDKKLISDINIYQKLKNIDVGSEFKWRSGIKHDCSKIMEFSKTDRGLRNGLGEFVEISDDYLYPMYKSSDIAKDVISQPQKYMLVTQRKIGEETRTIEFNSPNTWAYLQKYSKLLDKRKSSIYRSSPRFAVFGVGEYTFKPWKIVISGLYKNIKFSKIGKFENKSIVLDDTCYLLAFEQEKQADFILYLLTSNMAQCFIESLIFKDEKRPITSKLLNRINFQALAKNLGLGEEYKQYFLEEYNIQLCLF